MAGHESSSVCTRLRQLARARDWCTKPRLGWISVSFLASSIGVFASGLPCTYPLYTGFLKDFFNITQSRVSFVSGAYAIGEGFHVPAAILYDHAGPRWTLLVAAILTCSGFTMLFLSLIVESLQKTSYILIGLYLYLSSNGRTFTYLGAFSTAMWNTPTRHRAKVAALLDMVFEVATLMQIVFFFNVFYGDKMRSRDISNFLLFSIIMALVCHVVSLPFVVKKPTIQESESNTDPGSQVKEAFVEGEKVEIVEESAILKSDTALRLQALNKLSSLKFILSSEFLLLNFSMSLPIAISHFMFYNIAHFTRSLHVYDFNQTLLTVWKVVVVVTRISAGATLDLFRGGRKMYWISISVFVTALLGQMALLGSLALNGTPRIAFLMLAFVSAAVVIGAMFMFVPILLSDICGMPHFARNIAIVYTSGTVLSLLIQVVYGYMYESAVTQTLLNFNMTTFETFDHFNESQVSYNEEINCFGSQCVRPISLLTCALTAAALVMFIILALRLNDKCLYCKAKKDSRNASELENSTEHSYKFVSKKK